MKLLRRLFFKFSNHYSSPDSTSDKVERFSEMDMEKYIMMIEFLNMTPDIMSNNTAVDLYRKITKNKDRQTMNFFNFLESIKKLSKKYNKYKRMNKRRLVLKNPVKRWSVLPDFKLPDKLIDQQDLEVSESKNTLPKVTEEDEKSMRREFLAQQIFPLRRKLKKLVTKPKIYCN
jgi:hypothetical protein